MQQGSPFMQQSDAYTEAFTQLNIQDQPFDELDLSLEDGDLIKMLVNSLRDDEEYWNKKPFELKKTDTENTAFLLGEQLNDRDFLKNDTKFVDNRLFTSVRSIISYATAQMARPEVIPSKGDDMYIKGARNIQNCLYQHALDNNVDQKIRSATMNLISRKRAFLKLRWDPDAGVDGDIVTELVNPEDIIIDKNAGYLSNPNKIYHRIGCSIDQLVSRFPDKKDEIYAAYGINRGVYTQLSRYIYYYECWFTYKEQDNPPQEGVCWFIPEKSIILDKMKNPNWVYYASKKKEKQANITNIPPKPFVVFNYINTGRSYIDETCLVEQAKPMQEMLNKRGRQIWENADYVNGRWVANKKAFSEEDAHKLINKGAKTVALVDAEDVSKALANIASSALPSYVESTLYDARNEIDQIMGTPSIFKGSQPDRKDTLGRDLLVQQQASALQDDIVRAISDTTSVYYKLLLQMMRVYYTDDHWFQVKGSDGKYDFIILNGDKIDSGVKITVEADSTLPLDKTQIRSTAMQLWQAGNAISVVDLYEMLGMPDPEGMAERYLKTQLAPQEILADLEMDKVNMDAETDIQLLIANKQPEERDDYTKSYFDYFNNYIASNRYSKLTDDNPKAALRVQTFLAAIQHVVIQSLQIKEQLQVQEAPMFAQQMQPGQPPQGVPPAPGAPQTPQGPLQAPPPPPVQEALPNAAPAAPPQNPQLPPL